MAALSAKQSIKGDLREINREQMLSRFESKEHECITAKVSQVEPGRGTVTVIYDGTELYLFRNEQIPGEELEEGKSVKVYVTGITNKNKKPIVKISRTHKDLVKRLFELEVPEIYDGTVEVKSISREAGSRTKIAVWSKDEKIDIIPYSEVPEEFIARALAPAEVLKTVVTSYEEKSCTVIVPNNQLSLAIGNKGQNAKLAAKLTGFKIDIKPQFDSVTGEEAPEMSPDFKVPEKPVFDEAMMPGDMDAALVEEENPESAEEIMTETGQDAQTADEETFAGTVEDGE